ASALVVQTPADVTPGQRDRDRLAAYFDRLPRADGRELVWDPRGLWEREEIEKLASRYGWVAAFDPLEDPVPPGDVVYARLPTIGARNRISNGMLFDVLEKLSTADAEELFVAIASPRSFQVASTLQSLVTGDGEPE